MSGPTLPLPTVVIFDLDGTVVLFDNARLLAALERAETYTSRLGSLVRPGVRGFLFPSRSDRPKQQRFYGRRLLNLLNRKPARELVSPAPSIVDLLRLLKAADIPVAIASNSLGNGYGKEVVRDYGFDDLISCTVFREEVQNAKPDPSCFLMALDKLATALSESDCIWCVGDRDKDMHAAVRLRSQTVATVVPVAYGPLAQRCLVDFNVTGPHLAVAGHDEIIRLLTKRTEGLVSAAARPN